MSMTFDEQLSEMLSTARGRRDMHRRIKEAYNEEYARRTLQSLAARGHYKLRQMINELERQPQTPETTRQLSDLNAAMDLLGRDTKEEAARLSQHCMSHTISGNDKLVYFLGLDRIMYFRHSRRYTLLTMSGLGNLKWKPVESAADATYYRTSL